MAVGRDDLSGDDWAEIFATAVSGTHHRSPLGIDDIVLRKPTYCIAWSAKTVSSANPYRQPRVRLISGRNSPDFSFPGHNVHSAPAQDTGNLILDIWNTRVAEAQQRCPDLRTVVLMRDMEHGRFRLFESLTTRFNPADYLWSRNANNNLVGHTVSGNIHTFTWQPHGSQFTIIRPTTGPSRRFQVRKPHPMAQGNVLRSVGFAHNWISLLGPEIANVRIVSRPANGDTYRSGEVIDFEVAFGDPVTVTGVPRLSIGIGRGTRWAAYTGGSGTTRLQFRYVVVVGDRDGRGVGVPKGSIDLNNGTIKDGHTVDAILAYRKVTKNKQHKVQS